MKLRIGFHFLILIVILSKNNLKLTREESLTSMNIELILPNENKSIPSNAILSILKLSPS